MIITGTKERVIKQLNEKIENTPYSINRYTGVYTGDPVRNFQLNKHVWAGQANAEYGNNSNHAKLVYKPTNKIFPTRLVSLTINRSIWDEIIEQYDNNHAVDAHINKLVLDLGIETAFMNWLLTGKANDNQQSIGDGLFSITGSQTIDKDNEISDVNVLKNIILEAYDEINSAGAESHLAYTLLLPTEYRHMFTQFLGGTNVTLQAFLYWEYNIYSDFNKNHSHPLMYQVSSGNVGFHKCRGAVHKEAVDPHTFETTSILAMTGAGLVVADPKQVANLKIKLEPKK